MDELMGFLRRHAGGATKLVSDSRTVEQGDVFIAVPGGVADGRDHIDEAIARGAVAVLAQDDDGGSKGAGDAEVPFIWVRDLGAKLGEVANGYYGSPSKDIDVIAVTGTKGKTTTSCWCAQLLHLSGVKCAYVGTLGSGVCGEELAHTDKTTPDVLDLHASIADFADMGCQALVMEASSHGLAQGRLDGVDCDVAVFTNLGSDHLDYHGTRESYLASKALLFKRPELDCAVFNVDDDHAREIGEASAVASKVGCGTRKSAALRWSVAGRGSCGNEVMLEYQGASCLVRPPSPGLHNASNLALAVAAAICAGVGFGEMPKLVGGLCAPPGRMQRVGDGSVNTYVDFAHTPEALMAVLTTLRDAHPGSRLWCVFGCGGDRDKSKRPVMGKVASRQSDVVIITSDNPRDEDPAQIAGQVAAGVDAGATVDIVLDRAEAIARAVTQAGDGDTILVAGKGDEAAIIGAGGEVTPFVDAAHLRRELAKR